MVPCMHACMVDMTVLYILLNVHAAEHTYTYILMLSTTTDQGIENLQCICLQTKGQQPRALKKKMGPVSSFLFLVLSVSFCFIFMALKSGVGDCDILVFHQSAIS